MHTDKLSLVSSFGDPAWRFDHTLSKTLCSKAIVYQSAMPRWRIHHTCESLLLIGLIDYMRHAVAPSCVLFIILRTEPERYNDTADNSELQYTRELDDCQLILSFTIRHQSWDSTRTRGGFGGLPPAQGVHNPLRRIFFLLFPKFGQKLRPLESD